MSDIEKIRVLHDLKNTFQIDDPDIEALAGQIENSRFRDDLARFFHGFLVEDRFSKMFSSMPWVKLIHDLGQQQFPSSSKETFQVPDFSVFYETSKKINKPVLLEVKSVGSPKQTLELMKKQVEGLREYSKVAGIRLLIGIFWEKLGIWTVNTPDQFQEKNKHFRLSMSEAIKNDLSVFLGDLTFIFPPFLRKSHFQKNLDDPTKFIHKDFGCCTKDEISFNGKDFFELHLWHSMLIDSSFTLKEVRHECHDDQTILTENSQGIYFYKLSKLIINLIAMADPEIQKDVFDLAPAAVWDFCSGHDLKKSYMIPNKKTGESDFIFKEAFEGTWVLNDYSKVHEGEKSE